jgi:hypothetical protein
MRSKARGDIYRISQLQVFFILALADFVVKKQSGFTANKRNLHFITRLQNIFTKT